jgi:superfamily II DNA or RNA helicase
MERLKRSPYAYQSKAVIRVVAALSRCGRAGLLAPTGSGKTFMSALLIKELLRLHPGKRIVFLVQYRDLVTQTVASFKQEGLDAGGWMAGCLDGFNTQICVTTCQALQPSSTSLGTPGKWSEFSTAIFDECHETLFFEGAQYALDLPNVVGQTATPYRGAGALINQRLNIAKQDWIEATTLAQTIAAGFNAPYELKRIALPVAADKKLGQIKKDVPEEFVSAKAIAALVDVLPDDWIYDAVMNNRAKDGRIIVFVPSKAVGDRVAGIFNKRGVPSASVSDEITGKARKKLLSDLKLGAIELLTTVKVLKIGFDEPLAYTAVFLTLDLNPASRTQGAGRVLRRDPANPNKLAVLIDPFGSFAEVGSLPCEIDWKTLPNAIGKECEECRTVNDRVKRPNQAEHRCYRCNHLLGKPLDEQVKNKRGAGEDAIAAKLPEGEFASIRPLSQCRSPKEKYQNLLRRTGCTSKAEAMFQRLVPGESVKTEWILEIAS